MGRGVHPVAALVLACTTTFALFSGLLLRATIHPPLFTPRSAAKASGHGSHARGEPPIRGVNLGGWLVLEPWITPSLFYQFLDDDPPAIDEQSLCAMLGPAESRSQLRAFRDVWVTEDTIATLRRIGINTVRVPYGYWVFGDQPSFCPGVSSIEYVDRAVGWAEEYGLRVVLDLHGVPGSQNGFDNSGEAHRPPFGVRFDAHAWLSDANVNVTLGVLRRVAARYANSSAVVQMGLVNEPNGFIFPAACSANCPVDQARLLAYYERAWDAIRSVNSRVAPVLDASFRDGAWARLHTPSWRNARAVLDAHRYHAWLPGGSEVPQLVHLRRAGCDARRELATMAAEALPTVVGEWSLAVTDCMTFLNGVGAGSATTSPAACGRVRCPETFGKLPRYVGSGGPLPRGARGGPDAAGMCPVGPHSAPRGPLEYDAFYRLLVAYAVSSFEVSAGWIFWNFKAEVADPRWSLLAVHERGWLPRTLDGWSPPAPDCGETVAGMPVAWLGVGACASLVGLIVALAVAATVADDRQQCAAHIAERDAGGAFVKLWTVNQAEDRQSS
ncbi:hypothetical protein KFE25_012596 [Diacronema lutheri]|uniref:Glycoside hydrolase family 5 domain-containing protein n=1 Tax=Diacronema lutheri TaxID=2081491 RepID=A0A8J6CF37_DIALT|nr:hypothetical protein KFE25_012596 [Diacronema lutheri]